MINRLEITRKCVILSDFDKVRSKVEEKSSKECIDTYLNLASIN